MDPLPAGIKARTSNLDWEAKRGLEAFRFSHAPGFTMRQTIREVKSSALPLM